MLAEQTGVRRSRRQGMSIRSWMRSATLQDWICSKTVRELCRAIRLLTTECNLLAISWTMQRMWRKQSLISSEMQSCHRSRNRRLKTGEAMETSPHLLNPPSSGRIQSAQCSSRQARWARFRRQWSWTSRRRSNCSCRPHPQAKCASPQGTNPSRTKSDCD